MSTILRIAIVLVTATVALASPAQARWGDRDDHRRDDRRDRRDDRDRRGPPIVYERPHGRYGYVPPPVVFGLPGLFIGIH
jgi:hypothetical protein